MDSPESITTEKKRASGQVTLATLVPLIVGVMATPVTMTVAEGIGMEAIPVVLVIWCAVLLALAFWLNFVSFHGPKTFLPFVAAIVVVALVWLWQKLAFIMLVPHSGLTYGYFLRPEGARAQFWVLNCPFWIGLISLTLCLVAAIVSVWRAGGRSSLACMIPWWLTAYLVFALPSMYLDGQGNASVFI